ncbi:hypothetical protein ACRZ5S_18775 [Vibrio scophthalmi]|uniref:Uncharacterized protein n=1 Tax=Vibrio ichthyoenteri ATCC 700023 TaxID=870968 RepID=F9RY26_9VIBR|nr:hypothetical protein [Vibrio ichthyoenteri]EGU47026.1 hypothetical protein VII00023_02084 [Vibrio ichthyoenteri ATCC 700023]
MSKLVVIVIGCEHSQGLSKKDNKPYNFATVNYLGANDGWTSEKGSCTAVGFDKKQISMNPSPALVAEFQKLASQFPLQCELHLDVDPQNPQRNHVVDIKLIDNK